jgi:hypothetical protein
LLFLSFNIAPSITANSEIVQANTKFFIPGNDLGNSLSDIVVQLAGVDITSGCTLLEANTLISCSSLNAVSGDFELLFFLQVFVGSQHSNYVYL